MIVWRDGKGALTGGSKYLIKGLFVYRHSATSVAPDPPQVSPCPPTEYTDATQVSISWSDVSSISASYSDAAANAATYGQAQSCLLWDDGTVQWDLQGNVYNARWR